MEKSERLLAARAVEEEAVRLVLFVREGVKDDMVFGERVRRMASQSRPLPELKTLVLELVRMAKECVFGQSVQRSLVEAKADELVKLCHRVRLECGDQLLEDRQPEAKVKTWASTHAMRAPEVPATWEEMQRAGVLYGDGHHTPGVVVTGSEVVAKPGGAARKASAPYALHPIQSSAPKPNPERDRALLEIESMFGEETKFDTVAAKAPTPRQTAEPSPRGKNDSPRQATQAVQSPRKQVAAVARPVVPPHHQQQINAALPQSLGGLRVVK
jgi:hypothetical protein